MYKTSSISVDGKNLAFQLVEGHVAMTVMKSRCGEANHEVLLRRFLAAWLVFDCRAFAQGTLVAKREPFPDVVE